MFSMFILTVGFLNDKELDKLRKSVKILSAFVEEKWKVSALCKGMTFKSQFEGRYIAPPLVISGGS